MILELQFVAFIRIFFGQCYVRFPNKEPLSFFSGFEQKQKNLVFQIHLFKKGLNNQMAAVILQVIPSFYTK